MFCFQPLHHQQAGCPITKFPAKLLLHEVVQTTGPPFQCSSVHSFQTLFSNITNISQKLPESKARNAFEALFLLLAMATSCEAPIKQPNSTRQVRMTIATEIRLSFSSPLCCQNPWLCRTGNGTKKTRRHRWNGVLRSPLLNVKWASSSKSSLRMQVFVLLYPCSAAEGQIAMAVFCHRGQILQSRFECCAFLSRAVRGLEISRHLSR